MTRLAILASLTVRLVYPAEQPIPWSDGTSPRLEHLKREVASGAGTADFWTECKTRTTPLIEPLDDERVLVTFLYRGVPATQSVSLVASLTLGRDPIPLARLANSDVWFKTFSLRNDLRFSYRLNATPPDPNIDPPGRDLLNPKSLAPNAGVGISYIELAKAPRQAHLARRPGVPAGSVADIGVHSAILKADRKVRVYTPAAYDPKRARAYPVVLFFDGDIYESPETVPGPIILDNLIAAGDLPPMLAVFIEQLPQPGRNEELSHNLPFADFVAKELLPHLRQRYRLTSAAAETVVCGSSAGGLAALFFGFHHPEVFGGVLAQSAALWPGKTRDNPDHEWLAKQYEASPKRAIRIVMQPGALELGGPTPLNGPSILVANRHLRDVLKAKNYDLDYVEMPGGHEPLNWRGGIAPGLVHLLGKAK